VKTASVQQVPQRWGEILDWVAAGEEVEVTQQEKVIARLVPATREPVARPDFLARAKSVWGERPAGEPLSALVGAARGGRPFGAFGSPLAKIARDGRRSVPRTRERMRVVSLRARVIRCTPADARRVR